VPPPAEPARRKAPAAGPGPDVRERALALLRDERFAEALAVVEAGRPDRAQPGDLLLHGILLAQAGRLEEAEILARRLLDADGLYADAHQLLAVCLEGGAAVDVAIGHYRLAAYLDPAFAMPRLRLGLLLRRRGDHREAATELERALHLLRAEPDIRILLFGGGFGRISLTALCRAELDAGGVRR
jgi:chemotaxis protein methyltransferase CheR